jgi:hypothetical protein
MLACGGEMGYIDMKSDPWAGGAEKEILIRQSEREE